MSMNILQVSEEGFAQVSTDVFRYQAMGIAQVILCIMKTRAWKWHFRVKHTKITTNEHY